jgi:biopolymer transport protein ExbB
MVSDLLASFLGPCIATTPASDPAAAAQVQSVWDFALKGGVMMIPIGLCSLIALTVVVERLATLRRRRIIPQEVGTHVGQQLENDPHDPREAIEYCRANASPLANVLAAGLKRLTAPVEMIERAIDEAGQREVLRMRKHFRVLSVVAAIAPLLGLLGTIFGMITAFQTVAASGEALGKTELLAEGIYEAMITTAAGLIVAIPALVCYHWLSARVQRLVIDIDQIAVEFVEGIIENRHALDWSIEGAADDRWRADGRSTPGGARRGGDGIASSAASRA